MADNEQGTIPKPEVTDEHREKAKEMAKTIDEDRPTVAMPGTSNTVTGTAVNDWLDDDGTPKFGEVAEGGIKREDVMGERHNTMSEDETDAETK
ncbi:hypothetical protein [Mycolicibacterium arenosum]|uniref:Uncharacterized protein n=1 Tax=Mycolicibacterium arenosum TaxID=2952157 RepID=A0ABT1M515_9MYCO|nr:hypothetical protein [Mycolicibacterium sp. CAU 1645]MCP9274248.1 hypothetical protein [Mycolicibacterium sp. CAU 1645]